MRNVALRSGEIMRSGAKLIFIKRKISFSKDIMNITNLVFEGGGVKGLAFCGAVDALSKADMLSKVKNIIGSSAGAMCAGLLAVNYTAAELKKELTKLNMRHLTDDTVGFIRDIYRLLSNYGIYKGDAFIEWYGSLIAKKTGNPMSTFKDVYRMYGIDLTITGTCLNTESTVYFNFNNTPDMPVVKAVRISISIPGVFCAVTMNGNTYVDGGVLNNYPIDYYDNIENTLGFKLTSARDKKNHREVSGVKEFITSVINSMMGEIERSHVHKGYWDHTVQIDCMDIEATEFDIGDAIKDSLIYNGYKATEEWIRKRCADSFARPQVSPQLAPLATKE